MTPPGARDSHKLIAELDLRVRQRIMALEDELGRPLRVLHIGNIANNAYVNAKIQRRYGIEADVLVLDYYHIMGCPEWEEGVIERLEGTQIDPDWYRTKVGNFKRPSWFLQGPAPLCAAFLTAKARNRKTAALLRHLAIDANLSVRGATKGSRKAAHDFAWKANRKIPLIKHYVYVTAPARIAYEWRLAYARTNALWLRTSQRSSAITDRVFRPARAVTGTLSKLLRRKTRVSPSVIAEPTPLAASSVPVHPAQIDIPSHPAAAPKPSALRMDPIPASAAYPAVEPPRPEDIAAYGVTSERFREAFKYYDIVQGYAVDGIHPLLAGKHQGYACYEHGTLRDIPYQPNAQGRICAHAYRNAAAVFITNTDCVASAENLGIEKFRQFPIPHAFDSERVNEFRARHKDTAKPDDRSVKFIAPARHHWKHGDMVSWLKGNDVPIRAARLLSDQGLNFKIIFVRWGQEIGESEKLIQELDVGKHFEWIEPVPKHTLWQYYMSCHGVLDQFVIPAIGGVSFETLAFGRPLFTRIDEPVFKSFFGEAPPLLNVHTPEGLADAMAKVIRNPSCYDEHSAAALEWTAKYHSSQRIMEILLNGYELILRPEKIQEEKRLQTATA